MKSLLGREVTHSLVLDAQEIGAQDYIDAPRPLVGVAIRVADNPEDRWGDSLLRFYLPPEEFISQRLAKAIALGLLLANDAFEARITDADGYGSGIYVENPNRRVR